MLTYRVRSIDKRLQALVPCIQSTCPFIGETLPGVLQRRGHGVIWDFPDNEQLQAISEAMSLARLCGSIGV